MWILGRVNILSLRVFMLNGNEIAKPNSLATLTSFKVQDQTRDMILMMLLKDVIQDKNK